MKLVFGAGEKVSMVGVLPAMREASGVQEAHCSGAVRRRSNAWEIAPEELCTNVG